MEIHYPYPENTPGSSSEAQGYYHNLKADCIELLGIIQRWVIDNGVDMGKLAQYSLHPTLTLLRYLRANKFDTEKTIAHINRNMAWRNEMNVPEIITKTPEQLLGCSIFDLMKVFPHWHMGYDKTGRPVLYKQYGGFDVAAVKKVTTIDDMLKYHIWEQEQCARLCTFQSHKRGEIIETTTTIIDIKDMRMSQVTRDFLNLVKSLAAIDQAQFPETLGKMFIINAPSAFPFAWRLVKPMLDPAVTAKIQILGGPNEYQPVLLEYIGKSSLSSTYGGSLPQLSTELHPYQDIIELDQIEIEEAAKKKNQEDLEKKIRLEREQIEAVSAAAVVSGTEVAESDVIAPVESIGHDIEKSGEESLVKNRKKHGLKYLRSVFKKKRSKPSKAKEENEDIGSVISFQSSDNQSEFSSDEELEFVDARDSDIERPVTRPGLVTPSSNQKHYDWSNELQFLENIDKLQTKKPIIFLDEMERKEVSTSRESSNSCSCHFLVWCWRKFVLFIKYITFEQWLSKRSTQELKSFLTISIASHIALALSMMILSAYVLTDTHWVSPVAQFQMWTGVLVLLISIVLIVVDFVGFWGTKSKNRALLVMYLACLVVAAVILFLVSVASFLYATVPSIAGLGNAALKSAFPSHQSLVRAKRLIRRYNLILGISCIIVVAWSVFPLVFTVALHKKLKNDEAQAVPAQQIRVVLRVAQFISLCAALVMLVYGAASMNLLIHINFNYTLFTVYGLIYGGLSVCLSAFYGLWASESIHKSVVRLYYRLIIPLLLLLLFSAAIVSLNSIPRVVSVVQDNSASLVHISVEKALVTIQTQLLVTGVLCLFLCLFQFVSFFSAKTLHHHMVLEDIEALKSRIQASSANNKYLFQLEAGRYSGSSSATQLFGRHFLSRSRTWIDRGIIVWSVLMGLYHIFFDGTFVIFAPVIMSSSKFSITPGLSSIILLWRGLGKLDNRYISNDAFLICSEGFLAFIVGPLFLLFGWSSFVRAPYRHVLGIVACSLDVESHILFLAIECYRSFTNVEKSKAAGATLYYILIFCIFILLPVGVLYFELVRSIRGTTRADTHDFLLHASSPEDDNSSLHSQNDMFSSKATRISIWDRLWKRTKALSTSSLSLNSLSTTSLAHGTHAVDLESSKSTQRLSFGSLDQVEEDNEEDIKTDDYEHYERLRRFRTFDADFPTHDSSNDRKEKKSLGMLGRLSSLISSPITRKNSHGKDYGNGNRLGNGGDSKVSTPKGSRIPFSPSSSSLVSSIASPSIPKSPRSLTNAFRYQSSSSSSDSKNDNLSISSMLKIDSSSLMRNHSVSPGVQAPAPVVLQNDTSSHLRHRGRGSFSANPQSYHQNGHHRVLASWDSRLRATHVDPITILSTMNQSRDNAANASLAMVV